MRAFVIFLLFVSSFLLSGGAAHSQTGALVDCPSDINKWICSLDPNYNPVPDPNVSNDPNYTLPTCQNPDQATGMEKTFIMSVINKAPQKLKNELCSLTNIFVLKGPAIPHSWGFWENPKFHTGANGKHVYIALNENDTNSTFSAIQDQIRYSLGIMNGSHSEAGLPTDSVPETWGLLYVLAHEMGHVKWHRDKTCQDTVSNHPWSDLGQSRWTVFSADFGTRDVSKVPKPRGNLNPSTLENIYKGDFATALGAANPEEDFVETYSLRVLKKACTGCTFQFNIPQIGVIDLMDDNRGSANLKTYKVPCAGGQL